MLKENIIRANFGKRVLLLNSALDERITENTKEVTYFLLKRDLPFLERRNFQLIMDKEFFIWAWAVAQHLSLFALYVEDTKTDRIILARNVFRYYLGWRFNTEMKEDNLALFNTWRNKMEKVSKKVLDNDKKKVSSYLFNVHSEASEMMAKKITQCIEPEFKIIDPVVTYLIDATGMKTIKDIRYYVHDATNVEIERQFPNIKDKYPVRKLKSLYEKIDYRKKAETETTST